MVVTCNLMGGLGNQMFQIATCYAYAKDNNMDYSCPQQTNQTCSRKESYTDTILRNVKRNNIVGNWYPIREPNFYYNKLPIINYDKIYLSGYFQSAKYFNQYRDELKYLFRPRDEDVEYIKKYDFSNSLCIHVRRGDYLLMSEIHVPQSIEYYIEGYKLLKESLNKQIDNIYIFSDDLDWCKNQEFFKELKNTHNVIFVNENDVITLYMMTNCTYHVIANSSFSWWGAYLKDNINEPVIIPKKWFGPKGPAFKIEDIALNDWISL